MIFGVFNAVCEQNVLDKLLNQQSTYAVALVSRKLKIVAANPTFCRALGYSDYELNNVFVKHILHPDCINEFRAATDLIFAGQTSSVELQHLCVTNLGEHIPVSLALDRLGGDKNHSEDPAVTLILRNLAKEQKQVKEYERTQWYLQTTFDTIDQGVTIYDSDFRLVVWNKRYESLEIFPREFLKRGTYLADAYKAIAQLGVFGPGDPELQARSHIQALVDRRVKPVEELKSLNGRTVEIRRYLMPEGGLVAVFSDITEQRSAEAQLRQSQKMEAVGQLTGGIAHDFNNIIGIILGNLALLESQVFRDEEAKKRIENTKHAARRAADLTRQLLAFSRRESTREKIINVNRVIDKQRNLIIHSLTPQVELEFQFTEELWLTEIDPGDFEDALLNLAINARDAMEGRGRLTIETTNCKLDDSYCSLNPGARPGEYVQMAVSDTGKGISSEQQDRVFEPFFTTKEEGKGTGLGLAMVFGFVKRSHGYIKLYSEPGIGTTFRIFLPRAVGLENPVTEAEKQPCELPRGSEVLLVVDDEPDLAEIAQESLKALGYRVLTAANGKHALEILVKDSSVDLLFSDVVMPGGTNGYELAEMAVTLLPSLKILLTSGYTDKAVIHNGQARFKTNLLDKPYTQAALAQRVRQLLDESVSN